MSAPAPHSLPRRGARPARERVAVGRLGEGLAARHLERLGYEIVARNARTHLGEIDIVARDGHALVFVEVKTTRLRGVAPGASGGVALHAQASLVRLGARQRLRLRRLATAWLRDRAHDRPFAREIRFDAVGVVLDRRGRLCAIDHIERAW